MAPPDSPYGIDSLESIVDDVIVQTGKALRANIRDGKKSAELSNVSKIFELNDRFNYVLDDLEEEIVRAKAVLQRDLEKHRAKQQQASVLEPIAPAAVAPMQQAPPAPMMVDITSSSPTQPVTRPPGMARTNSTDARGAPTQQQPPRPDRPMAPFPNMGGADATKIPSPQMGVKMKPESRSPIPIPKPGGATGGAGSAQKGSPAFKAATPSVKAPSPAMKATASPVPKAVSPVMSMKKAAVSPAVKPAASPAVKAASPVVKTASPKIKTATPSVKSASPAFKHATPSVKPATPTIKATPPPTTIQAAKTAPKPTPPPPTAPPAPMPPAAPASAPVSAPAPFSAPPNPAPAPVPASAPPISNDPLASFFDLSGPATGPTQMQNNGAELNFTNMQFSLAPTSNDPVPMDVQDDDEFDIDAFTNEVTQNLLSEDSGPTAGAPVPSMGDVPPGPPQTLQQPAAQQEQQQQQQQQQAPTTTGDLSVDDLFNLGGTSIDMDLDLTGDGVDTTTNFDDYFFETPGDAEMADFNFNDLT